ncbi:hypothetical protein ACFPYI_21490 [Halomarina salina]|uniref:Uncharacterized protein n=1 Tax=Halomarina salina TaxID=1872699 RepID=A0ABD5RTZ3_9EURY|nr:hypothetical protein [Halomarina salina]
MPRPLDTDALVTLAAIVLCGVVVVPLLALSADDGLLALSAWVVGVTLSYAVAVGVAGDRRTRRSRSDVTEK